MTPDSLSRLIVREIVTAQQEVGAYPSDEALWATPPGIGNSGGNLARHLAGNLRFMIGAQLGGTGYVRDRDGEFAEKNLPRDQIVSELDEAISAVRSTLAKLTPAELEAPYPMALGGVQPPTERFLLHLLSHLAYHLGQINYHRRLVAGERGEDTHALSIPAMMD